MKRYYLAHLLIMAIFIATGTASALGFAWVIGAITGAAVNYVALGAFLAGLSAILMLVYVVILITAYREEKKAYRIFGEVFDDEFFRSLK